jgi:hydrogenase maturation protein HypF
MKNELIGKRLEISGVVQGVGFRPFLFGLAHTHGLAGQVSNTAKGVLVLLEGSSDNIEQFIRDIHQKSPLLSRITGIESKDLVVQGFPCFSIVKSQASKNRTALISPDVSVCDDCLEEMNDPKDRRFEYPFINCTNCGPRYTIIQDVPYDRPKTSMKVFKMCEACQKEYEDPLDRRFHAQPNACPVCGPKVYLTDAQGNRLPANSGDALALAGDFLKQGNILAVKGLGGFHLAVDAANDKAVARLRQRKQRPDKPFALMAGGASVLFDHVHVDAMEKQLLESFNRPIVLLKKKDIKGHAGLSKGLAPSNTCLGVMLPYAPLHYLLLEKGPDILVMTSGNRSGEPLSIDNEDALEAFSHIADYFFLHDRDIYFRADDSIARVQAGQRRFIRRSRGYAPLPVDLGPVAGNDFLRILGCGGGLKSTICLTRRQDAFLSPHIGDLDNPKVYQFYTQTIDHMKKILDIDPVLVAHDLHPGYQSTQYARSLAGTGINCIPVQHHHAHAVSCMAENHINEPVIALTLDGTGYGTDGQIWGGEILTCTHGRFLRRAQLSYVTMPGGDAAVLQPWRMAAAVLFKAYGKAFMDLDIPYIKAIDPKKLGFIVQMMEKKLNCPLTSSAGRIFDAVSSLLCICHTTTYESQAAMELEAMAAYSDAGGAYDFDLVETAKNKAPYYHMDMMPCIQGMVTDLIKTVVIEDISVKFHTTLVNAFVAAAHQVGRDTGIRKTVLSGGVFNNDFILKNIISGLKKKGFMVYTHTQVPTGDGGVSLGQVLVAAGKMRQKSKNNL